MNDLRTAAQQAEPVDADAAYQRWLEDTHAPALRRMDSQGAFTAGWQAALAQQDEPVGPGAWVASKDGRVIYDDASTDDGLLRVSGDFENDEQRSRYAQRIVDKLNAALAQQAEPVEPVAWVLPDALDWKPRQSETVTKLTRTRQEKYGFTTSLYTAPPQRRPLTEKEMYIVEEEARKNFRLAQAGPRGQMITYWDSLTPWLIRAVERAHGIKE